MFTALIRVNYTPLLRSFQSGAEARNASSTKTHHSLSFKTSPFLNYLALTETSIAANIGRALMIMQSNTSLLHQAFWLPLILNCRDKCSNPTKTKISDLSENLKNPYFVHKFQSGKCANHLHFFTAILQLGSLSTRVIETRTATGSELISLLTCPHTTTFTFLSIFFPLEMRSIKIWVTIGS